MRFRYAFLILGISFVLFIPFLKESVFATSATDSMIGYWKFDETDETATSADVSGSGNDLLPNETASDPTISTNVPSAIKFPDARSMSFNGSEYRSAATSTSLNATTITMSVWVKFDAVNNTTQTIAGKYTATNRQYMLALNSSNNIQLETGHGANTSTDITTSGTFTPTQGVWYNIIGTVTGTTGTIYVNGTQEATGTVTSLGSSSAPFYVGAIKAGAVVLQQLTGEIDDLRLYNRVLTPTEMSDLAGGNDTTATWTGGSGTTTNYENTMNWDIGVIPDPFTKIVIPQTTYQPSLTTNEAVAGLTIGTNGLLNLAGFNLTMNDSGTFNNNGTLLSQNSETLSNFANDTVHGSIVYTNPANTTGFNLGNSFHNLFLNDGLAGYWKLDESNAVANAVDSSGYGNIGTYTGTTAITTIPNVNYSDTYARSFNSSTDNVLISSSSASLNITGALTISAWIYPKSYGGGSRGRIFDRDNQVDSGYMLTMDNINSPGAFLFGINSATGTAGNAWRDSNANVITLNQWQHIAITWTGGANGTVTFYVNGVQQGAKTIVQTITGGDIAAAIGGRAADSTRGFDGYLDDVRVYNRVLSGTEITNLANGNEPGTSIATTTLNNPLTVNGNLILASGTLDVAAGNNYGLTVGGDFENDGGVFAAQNGTVSLNGSNQNINSSNTFYNLSKSVSSADTLTFGQQSTTTIQNTVTLAGASGNLLALRSSTSGVQFKIDPQATRMLSFLNPQDSNNTNATAIAGDGNFSYGTNLTNWNIVLPTSPVVSNSGSSGSPSAPSCSNQPPTNSPNLFQIKTQNNTATLYFVPVSGLNTGYYISYGVNPNAQGFGTQFNYSQTSGAVPYTINALFPGTWYFKVRGQNGCMPGDWSSVVSVKVSSFGSSISSANNGTNKVLGASTVAQSNVASCSNYTVKSGDSLWSIAVSHLGSGGQYSFLMQKNSLSSTLIHTGQILKVGC